MQYYQYFYHAARKIEYHPANILSCMFIVKVLINGSW
jgi:hypothetical protein